MTDWRCGEGRRRSSSNASQWAGIETSSHPVVDNLLNGRWWPRPKCWSGIRAGALHQFDGGARILDLHDQAGVGVVVQLDHDGFAAVMNVPEQPFTVLAELSRRR